MTHILSLLRAGVEDVIRALGYGGIAAVMLIENIFPPIPSEVVMPFAGFLVAAGDLTFAGIMIAGTGGALAGAVVFYWLGAFVDLPGLRRWVERWGKWLLLDVSDVDRAFEFFTRYGYAVVFFGRMIPGVRSLISIPAGVNRMPVLPFLLYSALGTLVWNALLAGAGMLLEHNWHVILDWVDRYETVMWIMTGLVGVWFVGTRLARRLKR